MNRFFWTPLLHTQGMCVSVGGRRIHVGGLEGRMAPDMNYRARADPSQLNTNPSLCSYKHSMTIIILYAVVITCGEVGLFDFDKRKCNPDLFL